MGVNLIRLRFCILLLPCREDQAFLTSLAGLVLVLFWIVPYIYELFETIKNLFAL